MCKSHNFLTTSISFQYLIHLHIHTYLLKLWWRAIYHDTRRLQRYRHISMVQCSHFHGIFMSTGEIKTTQYYINCSFIVNRQSDIVWIIWVELDTTSMNEIFYVVSVFLHSWFLVLKLPSQMKLGCINLRKKNEKSVIFKASPYFFLTFQPFLKK